MKFFLIASALASVLAACGGGAGGGAVSPVPTKTGSNVQLHGGFASQRSVPNVRKIHSLPFDVSIETLPSTAEFDIPDPYIVGFPNGTRGNDVLGYLTTTDGTMNGIPATLPSLTISQSGPALSVLATVAASPLPSVPPVNLGGIVVSSPSSPGQTTVTLSATLNGQVLTSNLQATSYNGLCVGSDLDNSAYSCPRTGLTWDGTGNESIASTTGNADVFLRDNGDGTTTLVFPHGATEIKDTMASKILSVPSITATEADFPGLQVWSDSVNGGAAFAFKAASGWSVKLEVDAETAGCVLVSGSCSPTNGLNTGDLGSLYGMYAVTNSGSFAY